MQKPEPETSSVEEHSVSDLSEPIHDVTHKSETEISSADTDEKMKKTFNEKTVLQQKPEEVNFKFTAKDWS